MSPAPRAAWLLVAVVLATLFLPVTWAAAAGLVVLAATAVDLWFARPAPAVERVVPTDVARGAANPFRVSAMGRPGQRVEVRQPQTPDVRFEPARGAGELVGSVVAGRRGAHEVAPAVVRTTGPLGLGRWDHAVGGRSELRSHPDLPGARRLAVAVRRGTFREAGLRPGPLGLGTDFESIREFTPDDDVRRINWPATERTGHPMANQYREDTERDLWCLVDTGRLMTSPIGDRTRLDVALDVLAAIAAVADAVGDRVGALAFDTAIRRSIRPRRAGGEGLLRALYDLEPEPVDTDYERAFLDVSGAKRALVVVFTDLVDEAAARSLLRAAPGLARRHAVLVVTATDPDLTAAVTRPPTASIDVHAATVATELLDGLERVKASLGRAGCVVVDAPPDRLPSTAVAAYLTLKARARL